MWKEVNVHATLPQNLSKLQEIAYNLWWVWNSDAKNIFRNIDGNLCQPLFANAVNYFRKKSSC